MRVTVLARTARPTECVSFYWPRVISTRAHIVIVYSPPEIVYVLSRGSRKSKRGEKSDSGGIGPGFPRAWRSHKRPSSGTRAVPDLSRRTSVALPESSMVAVLSKPSLQGVSPMATSNGEKRMGNPITKWSPRGKPKDYGLWVDELMESMRTAQPQIPRSVLDGPPTMQQLVIDQPKAASDELEKELNERLAQFQVQNTWLWDIARPSISLDGAYESMDRAHIKSAFMVGDLRDGYGLCKWLKNISQSDPIADQIAAVAQLTNFKGLDGSKEITRVHLDVFLSQFVPADATAE